MMIVFVLFLTWLVLLNGESYHGGTFLAFAGKESVILASDTRSESSLSRISRQSHFELIIFRV